MKRKAFEKQRARCKRHFDWWIARLGLGTWSIDVLYQQARDYRREHDVSTNSAMITYVDWRYLDAAIYVNIARVKRMSDDELERAVVHELCHLLVHELRESCGREDARDHEERVVSHLAKAFQWVRRGSKRAEEEKV